MTTAPLSKTRLSLFTHAVCPFAERAAVALRELGRPLVDTTRVLPIALGDKKPSYYADNIYAEGTVPAVLVHLSLETSCKMANELVAGVDGKVIGDSLDVVAFLDEEAQRQAAEYGMPAPQSLFPTDEADKTRVDQLLAFIKDGVIGPCYQLLWAKPAERDAIVKAINEAYDKLEALYSVLPADKGPYLLGQRFSIADLAIAPFLHRFRYTLTQFRGYNVLAGRPRLTALADAYTSRYSVRVTTLDGESFVKFYRGYAARGDAPAEEKE